MQAGSPLVHEERGTNVLKHIRVRKGDVDAAFAKADVIVEDNYTTQAVEHAYMQPEAGIGYIDEEGRVTVIVATQWPHDDLHQIAHMLNLSEEQVRETVPAIGGAFGGREDMYIQHLLALCAHVVRRPVKMVFYRSESIRRTGKRHPFTFHYKFGATRDGKLVAAEIEGIADAGAYTSTTIPVLSNAVTFMAGPYVIPNARIDGYAVFTNNAVTMAMRGFGATQPPVGYESQMDRLAEALGMDPVEFRLLNMVAEGSETVLGNRMPAGTGVRETLIAAAKAAGWREEGGHWIGPTVGQPATPYRRRGIGVASTLKNVCYSLGYEDKSTADVELALDDAGKIVRATLSTGATEVGQGVHTALQQIAAEVLGIEPASVRVNLVDTAHVPDAGSASASRHTYATGNAVARVCQAAYGKWQEALREETGEKRIAASYTFHGREARPTTSFDPETGQCEPHISYSFGTQIALVEVDVETGAVEVVKMWAATDCGRVINPAMAWGQVAGGVHMGVGYALTEDFCQQNGVARTRRFSEYAIPTILDMPGELISVDVEVLDPLGPFGAKGLGETPALATAPAILNAIAAATGARITSLPASPERVWRAMRAQEVPR
jgi:CO/xanthine dehydrogenase Mo-binding subunit